MVHVYSLTCFFIDGPATFNNCIVVSLHRSWPHHTLVLAHRVGHHLLLFFYFLLRTFTPWSTGCKYLASPNHFSFSTRCSGHPRKRQAEQKKVKPKIMEGINTQHTTRPKSTQLCMSKAIGEEEKEEEDEEKGRENRRHLMAYKYIVVIKCKRNTYYRLRLLLRDSGQGPKQSLAGKSLTKILQPPFFIQPQLILQP